MAFRKIVKNCDLMAGIQEFLHANRADVTGAAGDKNIHDEKLLGKDGALNAKDFAVFNRPNWIIMPALKANLRPAVFLDRDGTIIEERDYLSRPEEVVVFPGASAALKQLQGAGFLLFIVSNQSGVGRGYFTLAEVEAVNRHLAMELAKAGVRFQKIYVAPEAPDQPSRGRKPSPQFLFDARDEFGVDLARSYMIGDKLSDLECGWNAGVNKSLLVRTGYGAELEHKSPAGLENAVITDDITAATGWILGAKAA
jgi:D-glycero-D-manno-heptose 1,7-bisphosphate phosphatase